MYQQLVPTDHGLKLPMRVFFFLRERNVCHSDHTVPATEDRAELILIEHPTALYHYCNSHPAIGNFKNKSSKNKHTPVLKESGS